MQKMPHGALYDFKFYLNSPHRDQRMEYFCPRKQNGQAMQRLGKTLWTHNR